MTAPILDAPHNLKSPLLLQRRWIGISVAPPDEFRPGVADSPGKMNRLAALVDGVAEHDADVAQYVRGLIEDVAYDVLEDLFDARGR